MTAYPRFHVALGLCLLLVGACGSDPVAPDAATPAVDAATPPATDAFDPMMPDAFAEPPDAFTPPTPDAGPATVSFGTDVMPILSTNCMGSGCHTNPRSFFFGTGRTGCPSVTEQRFVVPFDPDASYVVHKIEGTSICGMRMPRGRTPLSAGDITTIRTWIAEGARDN
jgi:hypothetical protein